MQIAEDIDLAKYSTMRLGGRAKYLAKVKSEADLEEALEFADKKSLATIMIGGGSNIIWSDSGFPGLVIVNKIYGFEIQDNKDKTAVLKCGAGEDWDSVVEKTVAEGYSGLEQLSLIPGTVGATPVQNVGAYGREIKDVLIELRAFDNTKGKFVTLSNSECDFAYRDSRFKSQDRGRFFITQISLKLSQHPPRPPFYDSLQKYFDENAIKEFTPQTIRDAVIAIRQSKLPDPKKVANNGSFFANPIISGHQYQELKEDFANIPGWQLPNGKYKIPAAWLLENSGFKKDYHNKKTGMATWKNHALVLVNENAKTTADLIDFRQKIVDHVQSKFGIKLEQEPELI